MKIVVIGGSGLIGSKLVNRLGQENHEVIAASPSSGVNTITGEGLDEALKNADVVVDVANSPSFEDNAAMEFFTISGQNLQKAENAAGIKHHVALSVVGTERLQDSGYFRAKLAQEKLIAQSGIPYTIVRSTQFFEFAGAIAESGAKGSEIHVSTCLIQPISADDVADQLRIVTGGIPLSATIEIAGPKQLRIDEFIQQFLDAKNDQRLLIGREHTPYFGIVLNDQSLVPGEHPRKGAQQFEEWLKPIMQPV